jgi:RNA polymerase sigma factor for flagellar operon FliA
MVFKCGAVLELPGEELLETATFAVSEAEQGEPLEIVLPAILEKAQELVNAQLKELSSDLAKRIKLPAAALRTRSGLTAALKADGQRKPLEEIEEMPGTLTVLTVRELLALGERKRRIENGELAEELRRAFDRRKPTGRSFDAIIDQDQKRNPGIAGLGWALINLEGRRHVNLIWHQANKLQRSFPDREASELLTFGWIGLRTALRNYNPGLGFAFSTYACTRIVGAIRDGVRAENPVPKRLGTLARKAAAVETELAQSLGRAPTMQEVSEALRIEAHTLEAIRRTRTPASIEEIIAGIDRNGSNEPSWLSTGTSAEEDAVLAVEAERIAVALENLTAEEAEAIRLLIIEDRSPTEAKTIAGVTARQLRQRKERALGILRDQLRDLGPAH